MSSKLNTLRQIINELRYTSTIQPVKNNKMLKYILNQYRKYITTDQQLCKAKEEMDFMAKTYLCYLKSTRLQQKIYDKYHGKGERTIDQTAKLVGFKLPHDPK